MVKTLTCSACLTLMFWDGLYWRHYINYKIVDHR